jgi:endo-1,4-beta-xylanase
MSRSRHRRILLLAPPALAAVVAGALALAVSSPAAHAAASTLSGAAEGSGRYFGTAVDPSHFSETSYTNLLSTQFDAVTPENQMKWDTVEPSQNSFNYGPGDQVASYAQSHNQKIRGHNLVWHNQLPGWVTSTPTSTIKSVMDNHITNEVTHYKGKIYAWDVVNEPFDDSGNLRTDVFYQAMGSGYIAEALRTARAADPNAKLYLNDYNIEGGGAKANAMYNLVSSLKQQGVPIDGVGFESHFILGQIPSDLQTNMARFAALGLDVAITELDIRMQTPSDSTKLAQQANDYKTVVNACLAISRCVGITTWGITDKYSWVPGTFSGQGAALLWDENYAAKPAYTSTLNALGGAPSASPSQTSSSPSSSPSASPSVSPSRSVSPSPSQSSTTNPVGGCSVQYTVPSQWNNGFTAAVTITNTSSSAINSWTLKFTFPSGQSIAQGWSANWTSSGSQVTATNMSWNGAIAPGGSVQIGFNGNYSGTNTSPSAFTLNGATCTTV